jgi:cytidylate kinase
MKPISIAIDGPSGAGKSSIAKILANELGYLYIDTGALYRSVGYVALKHGGQPSDSDFVEKLLPSLNVELKHINGNQRVFVNNEDVSDKIRTPEVSMAASAVSAIPAVRKFLFDLQRETAKKSNVIMDGRDIGTVVLPDADVKIFLTASIEDRANRRFLELKSKGVETSFQDVLVDMKKRDFDDSNRKTAPLKKADDAVTVDTTGNTLEQSVAVIKKVINEQLNTERHGS